MHGVLVDLLRRALGDARGSAAVLFAAFMAVMVGLLAISVDVARMYASRQRYKIAADAAALAGVARLPDVASASAVATHILQANHIDPAAASVTFSPDSTWIYVSTNATVPTIFARVLGIRQVLVPTTTAAHAAPPRHVTGVIPIGVPRQTFTFGQKVTLKYGSGGSQLAPGNFGALSLGGNGASTYRNNFTQGYSAPLSVGDRVPSETGDMTTPTNDGCMARASQETEDEDEDEEDQEVEDDGNDHYRPGSPRLVFLPVVDDSDLHGKGEVEVVGFAAFHLEECHKGEVVGRYIRAATESDFEDGGEDYGLHAIKLDD